MGGSSSPLHKRGGIEQRMREYCDRGVVTKFQIISLNFLHCQSKIVRFSSTQIFCKGAMKVTKFHFLKGSWKLTQVSDLIKAQECSERHPWHFSRFQRKNSRLSLPLHDLSHLACPAHVNLRLNSFQTALHFCIATSFSHPHFIFPLHFLLPIYICARLTRFKHLCSFTYHLLFAAPLFQCWDIFAAFLMNVRHFDRFQTPVHSNLFCSQHISRPFSLNALLPVWHFLTRRHIGLDFCPLLHILRSLWPVFVCTILAPSK